MAYVVLPVIVWVFRFTC